MVVVGEVRLHPLPTSVVGLVWFAIFTFYLVVVEFGSGGHCGVGFEYDGSGGGGTGMERRWAPFAPITFPSISIFAAAVSRPEKSGKLNSKPDVPG